MAHTNRLKFWHGAPAPYTAEENRIETLERRIVKQQETIRNLDRARIDDADWYRLRLWWMGAGIAGALVVGFASGRWS